MFRRSFLVTVLGASVVACTAVPSDTMTSPEAVPDLELMVIDAQTPFADTGHPYLAALESDGRFEATGIETIVLPDYGRRGGAQVVAPKVAVADDRGRLEGFFEGLPPAWHLPPSHQLRYGRGRWDGESGPQRWGARVVQASPVVGTEHVAQVTASDSGVWLHLDREGTALFESMSAANVGQRIAVIIDDEILADPIVNEPIPGGKIQLSLSRGAQAHHDLAERFHGRPTIDTTT